MTKWGILLASLTMTACSDEVANNAQPTAKGAAVQTRAPTAGATALPAEVTAFKARRDSCDELRGEEPYDRARAAELARAMTAACTGTDRALAALKAKYAGNAVVAAALAAYDPTVE